MPLIGLGSSGRLKPPIPLVPAANTVDIFEYRGYGVTSKGVT